MKPKSIQTTGHKKDLKGDKIALFIMCQKCKKGRVYIIDEHLWLLQNKEVSSLGIEVECEGCKNVIYVGFGYIEEKKGFSYKEPDFFGKLGYQVLDDNGLTDLK